MKLSQDTHPLAENLRFRLLTIEGVNLTACEHISQNKVFEDLYSLGRARFIIIAE